MHGPALLIAIAISSAGGPLPYDTLTVEQCAALAREHAPVVLAGRAEARAAAYDSSASALNGKPRLSLDGGMLVAPEGFYDPAATNLGEYRAKVVLDWPLRDNGARRRARQTAALTSQGARLDAAATAREAGLRAIEVALDLLRTDEFRQAQRDAKAWLDDLATLVGAGVRSGRRGRAESERVAIEHDAAESAELTSEGARGALARELATLVGRPGDDKIAVRDPSADAAPVDSTALLARQEDLPDVRRAITEEQLRRVAIEDARSTKALDINLVADAGLWGTDLTHAVPPEMEPGATFGDRLKRDLGASVALEFKRPLTDPARGATILARSASLEAARLKRAALVAEHRRMAFDLLERGRTADAQLALARSSVSRASDNVLRVRSLYAGGGGTLLDLLDARRQLDDTRARLADARFEALKARFQAEVP